LKHEDEVKAMQDRIESLRFLSKEREAALVQQLQTFRKTADKSSVSAEQAWSAQVDQLSQQLKDAHASHADTHEDLDALTNKIRETEAAVRNAESERDLAIKRCESANTLAMEHGASLASVRGELEALTSAHDALKLSDASKASAIAKYEADLEELRSIAAARSASVSKLKAEITDLRAQAEKERERFEEALDEAMQAGDDLEEERRALSGKLKRAKTGRTREKQGHEIEVKQMMEEMEARFEVTEAELRKVILSKPTELENLRHRLREMQEIQDSAAASMAASEETGSAVVLQQLQSELRVLRRRASEYEEKGSAVSSADRIASSREEELMAESLALRARISQFENDKAELQRALARARRRTRAAFTEAQ
jgi:chromosome segregation ATPase